MRTRLMTICEVCGGTEPSGAADFFVFHCLTFCSSDCLGDYRTSDEERRAAKVESGRGEPAKTRRARAA